MVTRVANGYICNLLAKTALDSDQATVPLVGIAAILVRICTDCSAFTLDGFMMFYVLYSVSYEVLGLIK